MEIFMGFCGKMAVAQSGGPTAAINATLYGVIAEAIKENVEIFGAENGIKGMMEKKITHLNPIFSDKENCELLKLTPAAFLGSCRYKLPDTLEKNEVYESIFDTFFENDIKYFIYISK